MRKQLANIIIVALQLFYCACNNWGWQDLESDHEPALNIFALIVLDSTATSFVHVRQSLNLDESEYVRISHDTLWYGDSPYDYIFQNTYLSSFTVDSAVVTISDDTHEVRFFPVRSTEEYMWYYPYSEYQIKNSVIYLDTLHQFNPQPATEYFLKVIAPDGRRVSGSLITPAIPEIQASSVPDTLHLLRSFGVSWKALPDNYQLLRTITDYWVGNFRVVIEPGKISWIAVPNDPSFFDSEDFACEMEVCLTALDENYYQYFIEKPLDDEFVSFLLGSANSGVSCGVEGGYGVFGAVATDRIYRIAVK